MITRILAFTSLAVHWFNPLVWTSFVLSGKDMETSCDESVMKKMNTDIRADYSEALLKFATGKKLIAATPLAFGEGDTKGRVKNVMKYKKPVVWVSVVCLVIVSVVAVSLMSNGKEDVDINHSLTDVYAEIRNNDTLGRPLQIFSNMQIGDTCYIGVLAGNDIILSTAEKVNGQWEYMGNIIYPNANDGNSVVFAGKENSNGRYDVFLSTNPNLNSITRTFIDGNEITAYAEHGTYISVEDNGTQSFSPSMTIMEMSNDSKYVELLYKDFNDKILTDISTISSPSTQNSMYMAQNLSESEIEKIELVTYPNHYDNSYALITEFGYGDIISLINQSNGKQVEKPELMEGAGQYFYITKNDGTILTVGNVGNTYLQINNDYFEADYDWLNKFSKFVGHEPVPKNFHYGEYQTNDRLPLPFVTIQADDKLHEPRYYENGFNFTYDELPVIALSKESAELPINYADEFNDTAYWSVDTYYDDRVVRESFGVEIGSNEINRLHITDGQKGYIPNVDFNADYAICWIKANEKEEAEYVFKVDFNGSANAPLNDLIPMVMVNDKIYIDTGKMLEDTMFENS